MNTTVTLPIAQSITCTFTNLATKPTLTLKKVVVGAPGVPASNWTLTAKDGVTTVLTGNGTATGPVKASTPFVLTEDATSGVPQGGFTASAWVCKTGTQAPVELVDGQLGGLAPGSSTVCRSPTP